MSNKILHRLRISFSLCVVLAVTPWHAQDLPLESYVPGGIAIIPTGIKAKLKKPEAKFGKRKVSVIQKYDQWYAVVGIPLKQKIGSTKLQLIRNKLDKTSISFEVKDKKYRTQELSVKPGQVNLSEENLARYRSELKLINKAKASWSKVEKIPFKFINPVNGPRSSSFGLRRVFNGESRNPHSGMDIAAPTGT